MYLNRTEIEELIEEEKLIIRPLLDAGKQIGSVSLDLRLGTDFLVSFQGREPFIDVSGFKEDAKPVKSFFSPTRRKPGETFLLHPHQTVLCSTLEYVKLPENIFADLNMRSSYVRLGLTLSTIIQPGYCGCFSVELTNLNKTPIRVRVGARLFQARLFRGSGNQPYHNGKRKYVCQVRPIVSKAEQDADLKRFD